MITVRVRKGYQLTIPSKLRQKLEIRVGDVLQFAEQDGGILIVPQTEEGNGATHKAPRLSGPVEAGKPTNGRRAGLRVRADRRPRFQREQYEDLDQLIVDHLD